MNIIKQHNINERCRIGYFHNYEYEVYIYTDDILNDYPHVHIKGNGLKVSIAMTNNYNYCPHDVYNDFLSDEIYNEFIDFINQHDDKYGNISKRITDLFELNN